MKFPDEVPILGTRHTPDTDYRKAMTKKETSPRNFIGKPFKTNSFEVPEVLDYKNRATLYKQGNTKKFRQKRLDVLPQTPRRF